MYVCAKKGYFVPLGHVSKKEGRGAHQNPGPTYTFLDTPGEWVDKPL
jgi:hypothetical protein